MSIEALPSARTSPRVRFPVVRGRYAYAYLFMAPAVLLLLGLTVWPLLRTFALSVQNVNLVRPGSGFVGLDNFRTQLTDEALFWPAVWHSLVWTAGSVGGEYLLGLASAALLNLPLRGRGLFRMLVLIPWTVPIVISAMTWRWILQPEFGIANVLLVRAGILAEPIYWLGDLATALGTTVFVNVWRSFPFYTITLLAAMQAVPKELLEAAAIDGANAWQRFWKITLPHLKGVSVALIVLHVVWTFNNVEFIWLLTEGGPLHASETLATLVYRLAFRTFQISEAASLSVMMILVLLTVGAGYLAVSRRSRGS
ncbi:MAG: sugar ABC transporter permease [Chloroflexia bacterium]|nr:sugar ABC transporter permease [Chloroflexia bacterium]